MLWTSSQLSDYWTKIYETWRDAFDTTVIPKPFTLICAVPFHINFFSVTLQNVFTTILSRCCIIVEICFNPLI